MRSVRERVSVSQYRLLALLSVALALGAPLRTMYHLIDVVGSPTQFLVVGAVAIVAGAAMARVLHPVVAIAIGAVLFGVGVFWYVTNIDTRPPIGVLVEDTFALLQGRRLLQIADVQLWVVSYVSAPAFLTTYFAVRRWYGTAVAVSGVTLSFFVLTTDAGVVTTLLGVVGAVAAIGFGRLDGLDGWNAAHGSSVESDIDSGRRSVLEQLAAVVVVPAALSRVPGVRGTALSIFSGGATTIESSLVTAGDSLSIEGSISLAPTVRYTVRADEAAYWRVGCYDRYTGDGWVRTGEAQPFDADDTEFGGPPGRSRRLTQTFEAESDIGTLPSAWKPVSYDGDVDVARTRHEGLVPDEPVRDGDEYTVESLVLQSDPDEFRAAGDDYPDAIEETYLQLPESTPDRVADTTDSLTENAENPYDTAAVVEQWLRTNKEYSLDVARPRRNVADRFLHAMTEGYCTYFATTMVVMLRTQDVPARLAVGYTEGQQDGEEWTVRGLHSHAWVEVYIDDNGWVQFDPTPAGPREAAEQQRLAEEDGDSADTDPVDDETPTPEDTETPTPEATPEPKPGATATPTPAPDRSTPGATPTPPAGGPDSQQDGFELPRLPSREEAALGLVALAGTVAGLRRAGVPERVSRALWLRYQRPEDPATDVEQAFQRVMYVLGEEHRRREDGETVRAYLDAVDADEDVRRLARLRERLRYAGTVSESAAAEAIEIADSVVAEQ